MKFKRIMSHNSGPLAIHLENRGIIALSGADAKSLLQSIITNDTARLSPGHPLYAALLTPQGKYLHDFFLSEAGDVLYLDCEGPRRADLIRRLTMYRLRAKVEIRDVTDELAVVAIIGVDDLPAGLPQAAIVARDPRHEKIGFRILLPHSQHNALPCPKGSFGDYDKLRLALGLPDGSRDFEVERTLILEGNMEEMNGVDFNKGCYVGQELTARTKHRGKIRKRLLAVDIAGPPPAPDTPIFDGEKEIGHLRSTLEGLGIALLRVEDLTPGKSYISGDSKITPRLPDWLKLQETGN